MEMAHLATRMSWTRMSIVRMASVVCTCALLQACVGQATDPAPTLCRTTQCLSELTRETVRDECYRDLTRYPRNRKAQAVVDAKYQYPLTDAATYFSWVRMGGTGPSPYQWCKHFAETAAVVAYSPR